jgi:hypothetical protein
MPRHALFTLLAVATSMLAACASTSLRDSWADPAFTAGPFRKVMVVGISANATSRRVFEDSFSAKLAAVGVEAIRSYELIPQTGMISKEEFDAAARRSGADGLLVVHVNRVETRTQVTTATVPVTGRGFYGFYRGWATVPDISQYDLATVETNLFDVKSDRLVWSGITETMNPTSVAAETPGFADVIIKALTDRGLLPKPK